MAGHSKWAQIRHRKAGADAKRGALFSKLARLITVVARSGGPDPGTNSKLRQAIETARQAGMPKENIERAILRPTAAAASGDLHAVEYEAYGPGGSGFLIAGVTDNRNRTSSEIKAILEAGGGRLATGGGVRWMFEQYWVVEFAIGNDEEATELALIDAGAEDTRMAETGIQAFVKAAAAEEFQKHALASGLISRRSFLAAVPKNEVTLSPQDHREASALGAKLEEHPDVTEVWTNIQE